ncbi:unnamed protein product, partial [Polarella glacialis]
SMGAIFSTLVDRCESKPNCQWAPPSADAFCSSTAYNQATDGKGLVTGAEKERVYENICDQTKTMWWNSRKQVLPLSFDCGAATKTARYSRSFFFAGAPSEDRSEIDNFQKKYVEANGGWYTQARKIEADNSIERVASLLPVACSRFFPHCLWARFAWAYRRSFHAMAVTTATTCGSFIIGAASPLPQVQSFCVFAAVVVFVDWVFCVTFFAAAVGVHERFFKGFGCLCSCCGIRSRKAGTCLGDGCCWGAFRAVMTLCGTNWKCMPLPNVPGQQPEPRAMEKWFSGTVFRLYRRFAKQLVFFWLL